MSIWSPISRFARAGGRGVMQEALRPVREAASEEAAKEARKEARRTVTIVGGIILGTGAALGIGMAVARRK